MIAPELLIGKLNQVAFGDEPKHPGEPLSATFIVFEKGAPKLPQSEFALLQFDAALQFI